MRRVAKLWLVPVFALSHVVPANLRADLALPRPAAPSLPSPGAGAATVDATARWLVGFRAEALPRPWPSFREDLQRALEPFGAELDSLALPMSVVIVWPSSIDAEALAEAIGGRDLLRWIEPDRRVRPVLLPNDPRFGLQWGLRNTGQKIPAFPDTADCSLHDCDSAEDPGRSGIDVRAGDAWAIESGRAEVRIAVIDSGLDIAHPDLAPVVWRNAAEVAGNGLDDDGNGYVDDVHGWNACDENGVLDDMIGHGTQVATVAGGAGDDGVGMAGMAWGSRIVGIRALGPVELSTSARCNLTSTILDALEYASVVGVRVINMSYGADTSSTAELEKLGELASAGIVLVAAAGNDGESASQFFPAAYDLPGLIAVAAHTNDGRVASFSNRGLPVGVAAPGAAVLAGDSGRVDLWQHRNFGAAATLDPEPIGRVSGRVPGGDFVVGGDDPHWGLAPLRGVDGDLWAIIGDFQCATLSGCDTSTWIAHGAGLSQTLAADPIDASAWGSAVLAFGVQYDLGEGSELAVETSTDGVTWSLLPGGSGRWTGQGGEDAILDVGSRFPQLPTALRVRFRLTTGDRHEGEMPGGVYVWGVRWLRAGVPSDADAYYLYSQGTSLAAPFVAGTAALVRSRFSELPPSDVVAQIVARAAILPGDDAGEIPGRARLDAAAALDATPWLAWPGFGGDRLDGHTPQNPGADEVVRFSARLLDPEGRAGSVDGALHVELADGPLWVPLESAGDGRDLVAAVALPRGEWTYRFVVTADTQILDGPPARGAVIVVGDPLPADADGAGALRRPAADDPGCGCRLTAASAGPSLQHLGGWLLMWLPVVVLLRRWRR